MRFTGIYKAKRKTNEGIGEQAIEHNINEDEAAPKLPEKYQNNSNTLKKFLFLLFTLAIFILAAQSAFAVDFIASPDPFHPDTAISLDWSSVPGAQTYVISKYNGVDYTEIQRIDIDQAIGSLSAVDWNLLPETTYRYKLVALSAEGTPLLIDNAYEKTAVATTTKMISPYDLTAVFDINSRTAALSWKCSTLATGTIINITENGTTTPVTKSETTSSAITILGDNPVQLTVTSTISGVPASAASGPITVTPIQQPILRATYNSGIATVSWQGFPQIGLFELQRAKWNDTTNMWEGWIRVKSSLSGTSVTDTPDEGGLYRYRLSAKQDTGYKGYSSISELTSGMPGPTNLKLTVLDTGHIGLTWTNGPGNVQITQVLRKNANGSFDDVDWVGSGESSFVDRITVTPGTTYTYQVRAYSSDSNHSPAVEASITPTLPASPGQLYASVTSTTAITLNWTDLTDNEQEYRIERLTDTGIFTQIATTSAVAASGNGVTYVDNTVQSGKTYIYRVRAWNALGNSPYSNEVTVNAWDVIAPTNLIVTPVSPSRIDLSWSYTGTQSYNTIIERKTGTDGTWAPIYTTAMGTVKYSDTGLTANTRYFYRVKKALGTGSAGIPYPNDNIGKGTYTYLSTLWLNAAADTGSKISLSWSGNTAGADVVIERKMPSGSFSALTTVGPSASSWYDNTGLVPGASYTYRIKAKTTINESLYSSEVTVRNLYLEPPSVLSASVITGPAIQLKWRDNSTDENGFEIWRCTEGTVTYALYATVGKNVTTFTDSLIHSGVRYTYMVRAYVASGSLYSPFSGTASVGIGLVNPPSNLHYEYLSSTQVMLKWTDTSDNESGFKVEWKKEVDGEWSVYQYMGTNYTACQVNGLNPYTKYYFRVRAYNYNGNADSVSDEIIVTTALPGAPTEVQVISLSATQIKITWKDNSDGEDGFKILRKPANGYNFEVIAQPSKNTTYYYDNTAQPGYLYYYKVVSYNATGSSESKEASVRTNTKAYFSDLWGVSWAKDAVENLAGMGIIQGVGGTRFNPNGTITKAEFTAIAVRAFKLDTSVVGGLADVKSNKWYYRSVMVAENLGIISGDSKNRFYPDAAIKREEIAVILFKALEASEKDFPLHDNSVLEKFTDKNRISSDAVASIASLVGEGIIEGTSETTIGPQNTATRAQAAVFIYRTLNKINI